MRNHPISPVTEPLQYRAIGVVRGIYKPADPEQLTRGVLVDADGQEIETVVLGRVLTLMRRHLAMDEPHLWVTYPVAVRATICIFRSPGSGSRAPSLPIRTMPTTRCPRGTTSSPSAAN